MHPILKTAEIIDKKYLNHAVLEVKFKSLVEINPKAGQFNSFRIGQAFRSYSIASIEPFNIFKCIISVGHIGIGSDYFKSCSIGDIVEFIGPSGKFFLSEVFKKNILFLATGTGLAPFIPMFNRITKVKEFNSKVTLYFGVKSEKDLFYIEILEDLKSKNNWFTYNICLSQENNNKYLNGRISDKYRIEDVNNTQVYLCGNPYMVEENIEKLKRIGLLEEDIFHEKFTTAVKKN